MTRTVFIGDVHGCLLELEALLRLLGVDRTDRVVLVGDLVAKGPDSIGVLQLVRERGFLAVRGNHDEHLLRYLLPDEGGKPLKPLHRRIAEAMSEADWSLVQGLPYQLAFPDLGMRAVHAGYLPGVPYDGQPPEVMITIRSLTADGRPSKRVDDGVPWASRWAGPEHVVFGHDAVRGLQRYPHATGLDTGCVYGRALTALVMPEQRLVEVPALREWCSPRLPD
jgi:hypothetical protein